MSPILNPSPEEGVTKGPKAEIGFVDS